MSKDVSKEWFAGAKKDLEVAENLFRSKFYSHCLFFCHLSLEKALKAIVVKVTKTHPPFSHDLRKLADIGGVSANQKIKEFLDTASTFNIAGRYSNEKLEFYKKFNKKEKAEVYLKKTKKFALWLEEEFLKK